MKTRRKSVMRRSSSNFHSSSCKDRNKKEGVLLQVITMLHLKALKNSMSHLKDKEW